MYILSRGTMSLHSGVSWQQTYGQSLAHFMKFTDWSAKVTGDRWLGEGWFKELRVGITELFD